MGEIFVLVHGAWHGGWCWREVAGLLRDRGHAVTAPTLSGLGERCHLLSPEITLDTMVADIVNHIRWADLEGVSLVGHSFGGSVITGVADRIPERLKGVIYLDAVWLEHDQAIFETMPEDIVAARIAAAEAHDGGLSFPVPSAAAFGITDPRQEAFLKRHMTPHPLRAYSSKLSLSAPPTNGLPASYIVCTAPRYEMLARYARKAAAAGASMQELAAPHDCMVSHPQETADLLLRCATGA